MAEKLTFKVLRNHDGDRFYSEGETREGTMAELGHLVPKVLEPIGKAEAAPLNKAEGAAANNKQKPNYLPMTVDALKALAKRRKVDLGDASKKADIIAALQLADEQDSNKAE